MDSIALQMCFNGLWKKLTDGSMEYMNVSIKASLLVTIVRLNYQRNNRPKGDDQGMQVQTEEAVRQITREAALQVTEEVCNPRMEVMQQAIDVCKLLINDLNKQRDQ